MSNDNFDRRKTNHQYGLRSPKSKEGCRVTKEQGLWLTTVMERLYFKNQGTKTYCMIKRLILLK